MKFFTTAAVLLSPFIASTTASSISKRGPPETVYLANCDDLGPDGRFSSSQLLYYNAGHDSQHNSKYDDSCYVKQGSSPGDYQHWETGAPLGCKFPSGVTFQAAIEGDAQSKPDFNPVGTGMY
jgi:hypothetical protein